MPAAATGEQAFPFQALGKIGKSGSIDPGTADKVCLAGAFILGQGGKNGELTFGQALAPTAGGMKIRSELYHSFQHVKEWLIKVTRQMKFREPVHDMLPASFD